MGKSGHGEVQGLDPGENRSRLAGGRAGSHRAGRFQPDEQRRSSGDHAHAARPLERAGLHHGQPRRQGLHDTLDGEWA